DPPRMPSNNWRVILGAICGAGLAGNIRRGPRDARAAWPLHAAFRADEIGKIRPAEILRPAERSGVELFVADIGVGSGFEQLPRDVHRAALDCHMERRAVAVPYSALGIDRDAMREQPAQRRQVVLADRKMQRDGVGAVWADTIWIFPQHRLCL